MKNCYFILILMIFLSCKKQNSVLANSKSLSEIFGGKKLKIDTLLITKFDSKDLMLFYKQKDFETVWQSVENRNIILNKISKSFTDGLEPNDYEKDKLLNCEKNYESLDDNSLIDYDLLLTNNLQKYINHLFKGKLNPRRLYNDWDLNEKEIDVSTLIINALNENNFDFALENCKPKNQFYKQLEKNLQTIDAMTYDYSKPILFAIKGKIKPKESNSLIIAIKKRLMYWNYLIKTDSITKIYDKKTVSAIVYFQENHGQICDGIIGKSTINALNFNKSERREQIVANMERWRWYPDDFGTHYTLVNIPDYSIKVIKNGEILQSYNVIVGTDKRRSPVFTSKLSAVIFNPTWTVPPTIIKEDLIPDAIKSRRYFSKMHITIFDRKHNKVNPYRWNPEKANNYSYLQDPGDKNSLGRMKIIFPNKFSVYLHDTNHKDGFSRNFRSLSSGCTRVENPLGLAEYVLGDSVRWNRLKIDEKIAEKKTYSITISQKILHYQLYFTAWTENDHFIFRDDVYDLDFDLYCRLRN